MISKRKYWFMFAIYILHFRLLSVGKGRLERMDVGRFKIGTVFGGGNVLET